MHNPGEAVKREAVSVSMGVVIGRKFSEPGDLGGTCELCGG